MGDKSRIEWTEATWNPVAGCQHVSPGCDNCYAASLVAGRMKTSKPYHDLATNTPEGPRFSGGIRLLHDRLDQPLRWKRPRLVFVNSMSDLFHADVPREYLLKVFTVMAQPTTWAGPERHVFQVLTKRPGRMRDFVSRLTWKWGTKMGGPWRMPESDRPLNPVATLDGTGDPTPPTNIWLGVSVENQHYADTRIPELLKTPAAVRFLSCEPLLGPVDLRQWLYEGRSTTCPACGGAGQELAQVPPAGQVISVACPDTRCYQGFVPDVDWVIVGGESGPRARAMDPEWPRALRDQCQAAGVPFFFKQWGGRTPKAGGRVLDGRTWDEMP